MNDASQFSRSPQIVGSLVEDEYILMSIDAGEFYTIDGPAAHIWQVLEQPQTLAALIAELMDAFEVDAQTCRADTVEMLAEMLDQKLIRQDG